MRITSPAWLREAEELVATLVSREPFMGEFTNEEAEALAALIERRNEYLLARRGMKPS